MVRNSCFATALFGFFLISGLLGVAVAGDPDYESIADNVVNQSVEIQPGEVVIISGGQTEIELMESLQVAVAKAGGQPIVLLNLPRANKRAIMETPMEHLERTPTAGLLQARMADAFINVASVQDPKLFADVPEERLAATRQAGAVLSDALRNVRFRSVSLGQTGGIPTEAYAASQSADYETMVNMFWKAISVPPDRLAEAGRKVVDMLRPGARLHLTSAAGSDLSFTVDQLQPRINAGRSGDVLTATGPSSVWLPAGEAYACVKGGSASGTLVVPQTTFRGMDVENLELKFENGRITSLSAETHEEALRKFFDSSSPESQDLSVIDVGLNPDSRTLEGSHYRSWEMGGMVTLQVGNNSWAGGSNNADAGLSFHVASATLTIDGKKVVGNGELNSDFRVSSR